MSDPPAAAAAVPAQAVTAAKLVPEIIRRSSLVNESTHPLIRLGFICARAFYVTEREDLTRLAELEALVALREEELIRSHKALERESRRLDREMYHLKIQRAALDGYHNILSYPKFGGGGVGEEGYSDDDEEDYDDDEEEDYSDDDEELEEEDDRDDRLGLALAVQQMLKMDGPAVHSSITPKHAQATSPIRMPSPSSLMRPHNVSHDADGEEEMEGNTQDDEEYSNTSSEVGPSSSNSSTHGDDEDEE